VIGRELTWSSFVVCASTTVSRTAFSSLAMLSAASDCCTM
jgi:hypothetical protein